MTTTQNALKGKNLAEIFELAGFLTKDQTAQLASEARASGLRIVDAALEFGFLSEEKLVRAASLQSGFPAMTPEALDPLIHRDRLFEKREIFFRYTALPLTDGRIALHDAQTIPQIARDLGVDSFSTAKWCLGPRTYLGFRLTDLLGLSQVDRLGALKDAFSQTPSPPPPRLLEILLETAWGLKASDIHIEPFDRFTRIRARVEGHLRFWASVPREQFEPVGNLIRTQSGLTNRSMMKSHDGEFTFLSGRTEIPVRLSLIPTIYRQFSMVLRLLGSGPGASIIPEILGYSEKTLARIRTIVDQAAGITFFTGPTGCHAKGTKILMAEGSVKNVEEVLVGDKVMGPDSRPRTVLRLHRGSDRMVRIVPNTGDPFVVNQGHILSLLDGLSEDPVNLSVSDYETSPEEFRRSHCLWRVLPERKGSVVRTGFTALPEGLGDYYGFELDGDHLYLAADFTVHHNSGKNTSLHAIFRRILEKHPGKAFVEVADPIEYRLGQGVQAQVWRSETDAWSYASALKSTLRHDPDIIMVGETRDAETASIAFDAALTGHLVLSTLHVTEAAGVFDRMARLSVPPADLLSALRVVVNQRLVGRLCPACKVDVPVPNIPWLADLAKARGISSFADGGNPACPACGGSGTLGRYALAETMTISHEVRRTLSKTGAYGAVAFLETYREIDPEFETLAEMLVDDAASGKTGLSEVLRIVGTVL
uniref:Type II secretion system protein E n=1 Tax=Leptospirillum ferrodiazotrophum TaxID=412449 RepID=C6HTZ2_9BACT|nr:MAG: type II secretion system protein E [Leptospirillum ferrodiazotrophum]